MVWPVFGSALKTVSRPTPLICEAIFVNVTPLSAIVGSFGVPEATSLYIGIMTSLSAAHETAAKVILDALRVELPPPADKVGNATGLYP